MYSKDALVCNASGLHARPAALFSKTAAQFSSDIIVRKTGDEGAGANAKSMLSLMSKGLSCGAEITICAEGDDEHEAVNTLVDLLNAGCGE